MRSERTIWRNSSTRSILGVLRYVLVASLIKNIMRHCERRLLYRSTFNVRIKRFARVKHFVYQQLGFRTRNKHLWRNVKRQVAKIRLPCTVLHGNTLHAQLQRLLQACVLIGRHQSRHFAQHARAINVTRPSKQQAGFAFRLSMWTRVRNFVFYLGKRLRNGVTHSTHSLHTHSFHSLHTRAHYTHDSSFFARSAACNATISSPKPAPPALNNTPLYVPL